MAENEEKIGGNISLVGFGKLEPAEIIVVKKLVGTYVRKLSEIANYKELKIRLKQTKHAKSFIHEIDGEAIITESKAEEEGKNLRLNSNISDRNLYSALTKVLDNLIKQAEDRVRGSMERGKKIKRREGKEKIKEKQEEEKEEEKTKETIREDILEK